jgi:hypothetical protein
MMVKSSSVSDIFCRGKVGMIELTMTQKRGKDMIMEAEGVSLAEGTKFHGFEKAQLRDKKREAMIGFMSMNILEPPDGAFWGQFNNRPVDEKAVSNLAKAFSSNMDHCTDGNAIDVAVKRYWIKDVDQSHRSVEGMSIEEVAKVEFTQEGLAEIKGNNLWMLGGNHRRQALTKYVGTLTADLKTKNKEIMTLDMEMRKGDPNGALAMELTTQRIEVSKLKKKVEQSCKWVVRLYDRGV